MPPELALAFEQEQREIQGRIAQEDREDDSAVVTFNPKDFIVCTAAPYFPNWFLASHKDDPEIPCGHGKTPEAAIESWIEGRLCPCGMKCSEDCDCGNPDAPF